MIKCNDCGKELPDDSCFCQYCGSKNIKKVIPQNDNPKRIIYKRCMDCGKELPDDSEFCQYCGSKRVATVKDDSETKIKKQPNQFPKTFIILLSIITLCACCSTVYLLIKERNFKKIIKQTADGILNQDFYADKYILNSPKNEEVFIGHSSRILEPTVYFSTSSDSVRCVWGKWKNGQLPLIVTYEGNGIEHIELSNNRNNDVIYIIVVGK